MSEFERVLRATFFVLGATTSILLYTKLIFWLTTTYPWTDDALGGVVMFGLGLWFYKQEEQSK